MGLFSAISALTAIRKLKTGKSAKLSLAQIADGIINLQDAYKKLPSEEFQCVYNLYKAFQGAKTKLELHSMDDYYLYAIDIITPVSKFLSAHSPLEKRTVRAKMNRLRIFCHFGTRPPKPSKIQPQF